MPDEKPFELPVSAARCPLCRKPVAAEYAPFCSKRCADIDLHRWVSGSYAVPLVEPEDDDAPPPPQP